LQIALFSRLLRSKSRPARNFSGTLIWEELGHSLDVIPERREICVSIERGILLLDQHVQIFGEDRESDNPTLLSQKGGDNTLALPIEVLRRVVGPLGETAGLVRYHLHHANPFPISSVFFGN
jgi:hypothetical protein